MALKYLCSNVPSDLFERAEIRKARVNTSGKCFQLLCFWTQIFRGEKGADEGLMRVQAKLQGTSLRHVDPESVIR